MIAITFTAAFVYVVFAMLRPALFAGLFTTDPELIVIVEKVLPVYIAGMAIFDCRAAYRVPSSVLARRRFLLLQLLRKVILLIPLALILPHFFGVMGVYYAEPIAMAFCYHCRYAVSLQYPENSFNRNTCKK